MGISGYSLGDSIDQDPPKNLHLVQVPKSGPEPSLWQGVKQKSKNEYNLRFNKKEVRFSWWRRGAIRGSL